MGTVKVVYQQDLVDVMTANNTRLNNRNDAAYVAKEQGKGLSSNDFTTVHKTKLEALPAAESIVALDANGKVPAANIPDSVRAIETVDNYSQLLALTGNFDGRRVLVLDAAHGTPTVEDETGRVNGDQTVEDGFAEYTYSATNSQWVKTAEGESMDIILQWTNLTGRPSVINNLNSTSSTDVLSAAQGKVLGDAVSDMSSDITAINNALESTSPNMTSSDVAAMIAEIWGDTPAQGGEQSGGDNGGQSGDTGTSINNGDGNGGE